MSTHTEHTARSVLDRFYAAERQVMEAELGKQDFNILKPLFSEDFKLRQTAALPYGGTYHGQEGMLQFMQEAAKWFSKLDVQPIEIFDKEGSSHLIIQATVHYQVRATGEESSYPFVQEVDVDLKNGLITEIRPWYWDVQGLNRMLGYEGKDVKA